jgi:hypothetical protein
MRSTATDELTSAPEIPNGSGAAALLSAGIGACALAILAIGADRVASLGRMMIFYKPTGPLSGVTTSAIIVWLIVWGILEWRWRKRNVRMNRVSVAAAVLLIVALLLTFPPLADAL